jgi:hypothetical protein
MAGIPKGPGCVVIMRQAGDHGCRLQLRILIEDTVAIVPAGVL